MNTTKARIDRLTAEAVAFIRRAESLALKMDARGIHVAFSGGKDSQVLLALAEMAGVRHHAEMQLTSVDPPQVVRFVRENYPQVHLNRPRTTMYKLIIRKHILPTRVIRYCCSEFKEFAGRGSVTATGIRRAESANLWNWTRTLSFRRSERKPCIVSATRTRYLLTQFLNGRTRTCGDSSIIMAFRIAPCTTGDINV